MKAADIHVGVHYYVYPNRYGPFRAVIESEPKYGDVRVIELNPDGTQRTNENGFPIQRTVTTREVQDVWNDDDYCEKQMLANYKRDMEKSKVDEFRERRRDRITKSFAHHGADVATSDAYRWGSRTSVVNVRIPIHHAMRLAQLLDRIHNEQVAQLRPDEDPTYRRMTQMEPSF